jgi:hypothetical protein
MLCQRPPYGNASVPTDIYLSAIGGDALRYLSNAQTSCIQRQRNILSQLNNQDTKIDLPLALQIISNQ